MIRYEVELGIDRAARDTGRRVTMVVKESDPLSAAITAEQKADAVLTDPVEYTHAISVTAVSRQAGTPMRLAMAA